MTSTNGRLTDLACPWCEGAFCWKSPSPFTDIVGECDVTWSNNGKFVHLKVARYDGRVVVMSYDHKCHGLDTEESET